MATLLAVTAHPDDESFIFGGALAMHARGGGRSVLLCLTDGQAGRTGGVTTPDRLGETRREELRRAARVLGIPELITPGLMDGALDAYGDGAGSALVSEVAARVGARTLLTFGPEGASGHADHRACWRWTLAAAGGRRLYASTFPPNLEIPRRAGPGLPVTTVVDVSALGDAKRRAFLEHRTQIDHLELFDRVLSASGGAEYYHRVLPPWPPGAPLESSLDSPP
ncbi:MAG: PIG-L deacetylase family protein [Planctomycetaceae bacterium]